MYGNMQPQSPYCGDLPVKDWFKAVDNEDPYCQQEFTERVNQTVEEILDRDSFWQMLQIRQLRIRDSTGNNSPVTDPQTEFKIPPRISRRPDIPEIKVHGETVDSDSAKLKRIRTWRVFANRDKIEDGFLECFIHGCIGDLLNQLSQFYKDKSSSPALYHLLY